MLILKRCIFFVLKWMQVSSGMDCSFAQDAVAVNNAEKHCCIVGELSKRLILTPDVDSILSMVDLSIQF